MDLPSDERLDILEAATVDLLLAGIEDLCNEENLPGASRTQSSNRLNLPRSSGIFPPGPTNQPGACTIIPTDPRNFPRDPRNIPGASTMIPTDPRNFPRDPRNIPGASTMIPTDPRNIPRDPRNIPGASTIIPTDPRNFPRDPRNIPGASTMIPIDPTNLPGTSTMCPTDPTNLPIKARMFRRGQRHNTGESKIVAPLDRSNRAMVKKHIETSRIRLLQRHPQFHRLNGIPEDFYLYLYIMERNFGVLEDNMQFLVGQFVQFGTEAFRNIDIDTEDLDEKYINFLSDKYGIEEDNERNEYQIGIRLIVANFPVLVAKHLNEGTVRPHGRLNLLPNFLAFPGGGNLIPPTAHWEPLLILWKVWKSVFLCCVDVDDPELEYLNLSYYTSIYIERDKLMMDMNAKVPEIDAVLKVIEDLLKYYKYSISYRGFEAIFDPYAKDIWDFYQKNAIHSKIVEAVMLPAKVRTGDVDVKSPLEQKSMQELAEMLATNQSMPTAGSSSTWRTGGMSQSNDEDSTRRKIDQLDREIEKTYFTRGFAATPLLRTLIEKRDGLSEKVLQELQVSFEDFYSVVPNVETGEMETQDAKQSFSASGRFQTENLRPKLYSTLAHPLRAGELRGDVKEYRSEILPMELRRELIRRESAAMAMSGSSEKKSPRKSTSDDVTDRIATAENPFSVIVRNPNLVIAGDISPTTGGDISPSLAGSLSSMKFKNLGALERENLSKSKKKNSGTKLTSERMEAELSELLALSTTGMEDQLRALDIINRMPQVAAPTEVREFALPPLEMTCPLRSMEDFRADMSLIMPAYDIIKSPPKERQRMNASRAEQLGRVIDEFFEEKELSASGEKFQCLTNLGKRPLKAEEEKVLHGLSKSEAEIIEEFVRAVCYAFTAKSNSTDSNSRNRRYLCSEPSENIEGFWNAVEGFRELFPTSESEIRWDLQDYFSSEPPKVHSSPETKGFPVLESDPLIGATAENWNPFPFLPSDQSESMTNLRLELTPRNAHNNPNIEKPASLKRKSERLNKDEQNVPTLNLEPTRVSEIARVPMRLSPEKNDEDIESTAGQLWYEDRLPSSEDNGSMATEGEFAEFIGTLYDRMGSSRSEDRSRIVERRSRDDEDLEYLGQVSLNKIPKSDNLNKRKR